MSEFAQAVSSKADIDPLVAELVNEFAQKLQSGTPVDIDEFARQYPAHAVQLHKILPALQVLADLEQTAEHDQKSHAHPNLTATPLGDFRLVREIGRGGMGVVYEAEQMSLGRRVALKVLPFASTLDPKQLQRFKNEAQAAAGLHHTNIVPVFATGCERGVHYYAMQFIEGQTLADVIAEKHKSDVPHEHKLKAQANGDITVAASSGTQAGVQTALIAALSTQKSNTNRAFFHAIARLGIQAAEALDYSHELGIIHRDIKPANMLVDARGNLWITDFGLAHCQSQAGLTMSGDLVGTLRYMSPEQALAKRVLVDHRTDIYSLGATLYELLTGEPVFTGHDRQELLRQIAFEEPKPLRRHNKAIPAELETIVLKALEKNPADRYATAKELAEDLERFVKDEPIRARRPSLARRAKGWCRHHKPLVAALVTLLVLAGGAVTWQLWQRTVTAQMAENDWHEADHWWQQKQWAKALPHLERASGLLARSGLTALQAKVDARRRDVAMVARLDDASLQVLTDVFDSNARDWPGVHQAYQAAFVDYGLDVTAPDKEETVKRIRASGIRSRLIQGLEDWIFCTERIPGASTQPLREIVALADDDPWRHHLRQLHLSKDRVALERLAESKEAVSQPHLALLCNLLSDMGADEAVLHLLRKAQQLNPADFWLNANLATALLKNPTRAAEAVGFIRAALVVQPQSPWLHLQLAAALDTQGMHAEAETARSRSFELNPSLGTTHSATGDRLLAQKKWPEAEAAYRRAITLRPNFAGAYNNLGNALQEQRKHHDAEAAFRKAIELDPKLAPSHVNLGRVIAKKGKWAEAATHFRKAVDLEPRKAEWAGLLAESLTSLGAYSEAIAAYRQANEIRPTPAAMNNLGSLLNRQGDFIEAEKCFRRCIELTPHADVPLWNLGEVLLRQGKYDEAITCFKKRNTISFSARRLLGEQCVLLGDKLPKLLRKEALPADANERVVIAHLFALHGMHVASVRLFGEAFAIEPKLANDLTSTNLVQAAEGAMLAASGEAKDGDKLDDNERARLRRQALAWLRDDLTLCA
jgi:serine/threonine protein kinase/Flp pilus assembly protein TadD